MLPMSQTPEPLATFLRKYWNINVAAYASDLGRSIRSGRVEPEKANLFKTQLMQAVISPMVSPAEYHQFTDDNEFSTYPEIQACMKEFWEAVFPGEAILPRDGPSPP